MAKVDYDKIAKALGATRRGKIHAKGGYFGALQALADVRALQAQERLGVGSKVKLIFGLDEVEATVIEDRGNIGVGGRQLFRVRFDIQGSDEPIELEVPAEDLRL